MFTCYYCEREIQGVTIVVDKTHLAHSECAKMEKDKIADKTITLPYTPNIIKKLISDKEEMLKGNPSDFKLEIPEHLKNKYKVKT